MHLSTRPGASIAAACVLVTLSTACTMGDPTAATSVTFATDPAEADAGCGTYRECPVDPHHDGVKNGDETDVDCGGSSPTKCDVDAGCARSTDCASGVCKPREKRCAAPTFYDGVKNGAETDIDCGGPSTRRCRAGAACAEHSDCESNGCGYDHRCATGATCTSLEGGHTCGPEESDGPQLDCCARAKVGKYLIDKYLVTAGRMRAFLSRVDGDVQAWASKLPATAWDQAWTPMLPRSMDGIPGDPGNANTQLGPYFGKRACTTGNHTGHTFWTPEDYGDKKDFSQAVLDRKALNCVPWWLLSAMCAFDGGHLAREAELRAAYTNDGSTAYPWGARGTYTTVAQNDYAVGMWSYFTPDTPASARQDTQGFLDVAFYIAPPGRRPLGYSATGVTDLVGNLLEWVGDSERQFVWKGSFENHAREGDALEPPVDDDPYVAMRSATIPWRWTDVVALGADPENDNGYYALGGRCAY